MAIVDPTAGGNPVELTKERALGIFDAAMAGRCGVERPGYTLGFSAWSIRR